MATLYELRADEKCLLDMLEDPELDEQTVLDTLEGIKGELSLKVDSYIYVIKRLEADIKVQKANRDALKDEMEFYDKRVKASESGLKKLKKSIQEYVEEQPEKALETERFKLSVVNNGGVRPMWVTDDLSQIPAAYKEQIWVAKKDAIRKHLEELESSDISESWARLDPRGRRLSIK